ncbi:MAG: hypothetical protein E7033_02170 [Akkermansiaceae bacterium]|nr:hypothetical protein [Akkermansiaceae bacterium]
MGKKFSSLLKKQPVWFAQAGDGEEDIILGTMVRSVRNVAGHRFPGWSTAENRKAVADLLVPAVMNLPGNKSTAFCAEVKDLSYVERRVLLERKQISQCLAARQDGCHLIINGKQDAVFMINEEEHLVMHLFSPYTDYTELVKKARKITSTLEKNIPFARSSNGDYLTSMPVEAGTGIQLYTLMHLPALNCMGMMQQISRGLEKLMLNISPLYPNLRDDSANLFVIFSPPILQGTEDEMISHLDLTCLTLERRELEVRYKLRSHPYTNNILPDMVGRAYGLCRYAARLEYTEFLHILSMLRFGAVDDYIPVLTDDYIDFLTQFYMHGAPYHIQYITDNAQIDIERCRVILCQKILKNFHSPRHDSYYE